MIRIDDRTNIRVDLGVSYNKICKKLKNWAVVVDRVVGLSLLGTSKNRHDVNLIKMACTSLRKFGDDPRIAARA